MPHKHNDPASLARVWRMLANSLRAQASSTGGRRVVRHEDRQHWLGQAHAYDQAATMLVDTEFTDLHCRFGHNVEAYSDGKS